MITTPPPPQASPAHARARAGNPVTATAAVDEGTPRNTDPGAFIVKLNSPADLAAAESMPRGAERKAWVFNRIVEHAHESQRPFLAIADALKAKGTIKGYSHLDSPNALVVTAAAFRKGAALKAFQQPGVTIFDNSKGRQVWPAPIDTTGDDGPGWGLDPATGHVVTPGDATNRWPVELMQARDAWALGADGRGMTYGVVDTGLDASHDALRQSYRGTQPDGTMVHDYNWMDFEEHSAVPTDGGWGHGTHIAGCVVGQAPRGPFGVAPGAKVIGARMISGSTDDALKALQWMQAPTKRDGTAPDPSKAPDVVGMSWYMGRPTEDLFRESIRNLRAAGIEVVKSAGNEGPKPQTITSPGHHPEILATAAVDSTGKVAKFSSRGPARVPAGAPAPKPDFAAPGVAVTSCITGGRWAELTGTSMAQPHLSGAILALLSRYPQLTHDQVVAALAAGATDAGAPGFDPEYGHGTVNMLRAVQAAATILGQKSPSASPTSEPAAQARRRQTSAPTHSDKTASNAA